jgi:hypothetical protein
VNILLIDDETSLRRTMRTALETMGHHVSEARDGTQALDLLVYLDRSNARNSEPWYSGRLSPVATSEILPCVDADLAL